MSRLVLKTKKPIFLLFLEVPGCSGCVNFGNGPLSDLLLVEAVVKEFIPGCIQVFTTEEIAQRMVKVLEKQNVPFYLKQIPMNYQNWKKITLEMYRYLSGEVVLDGVISTTAGHLNGEVVMVEYYEKIISEKMFHSIDGLKVIDYDMKRSSRLGNYLSNIQATKVNATLKNGDKWECF
eukprot:gene7545-11869_t